jgi:glycerol-3-phosphate O-acyltransferase
VQENYSIEFFIEGGRTRTGRLVYPKLGILHYLVNAIDEHYNNDLVFVPISIGYDRVLEEGSYAQELKGKNKAKETMGSVVKSSRVLWRKHGMAYVNFDKPFTLKEIESTGLTGEERVKEVANRVVKGINRVTSIGPFNLTTTAMLLMSAKGFSRTGLIEKMKLLHDYFTCLGVNIHEKARETSDFEEILNYVFASYLEDKIIEEIKLEDGQKIEGIHIIREENRARIAFYKNSISHFLLGISFTCLGILVCRKNGQTIKTEEIVTHFQFLKKLLSREYIYPNEFDDELKAVRGAVAYMSQRGLVNADNGTVTLRDDKSDEILFFARTVQEMLESYLIVIDMIDQIFRKKIPAKEMMVDIRKNGVKLYHLGKVKLPESLSAPNYKSALQHFMDDGIIEEDSPGKKGSAYSSKDQVTPRKLRDAIDQYIASLI